MYDPFATALVALHNAAGSIAAKFYPGGGGAGADIRVIRSQPDQLVGFGDSEVIMASNLIDIQRSEVADPVSGDEVQLYLDAERTMPGDRLRLAGGGRLDAEGVSWRCPAEPI